MEREDEPNMSPKFLQLGMLWSLWIRGRDMINAADISLFRCQLCNEDGEGSPALCPSCGPHIADRCIPKDVEVIFNAEDC